MQPATTVAERQAQGVLEIVGRDLPAMLAFYQSLGFELERHTGDFAVVHWQGCRLFLAQDAAAQPHARWSNLRIVVEDVDALWARVQALGLETSQPIADRYYGLRDFIVLDPSGFGIRFAQVLPV